VLYRMNGVITSAASWARLCLVRLARTLEVVPELLALA
jgi:hypothetical protein